MNEAQPTKHVLNVDGQPVVVHVYGQITDEQLKQSLLRLIVSRRRTDESNQEVAARLARARSVQLRQGFGGYPWLWCINYHIR